MRKTLEAQGPLFRRGVPTLQTSLTLRELPPCLRHLRSENLFRFLRVAGTWGKFLSFGRYKCVKECGYRTRLVNGKLSPLSEKFFSIGAERHTGRSAKSATNLNHFYPVAERGGKPPYKSRWTGFGSEQPEFVVCKWLHGEFAPQKHRGKIPLS